MRRLPTETLDLQHSFFNQDMPAVRALPIDMRHLSFFGKVLKLFTHKRKWEVMEDYCLRIPWLSIAVFVPRGFVFDFASVPRFFWPILSPTGVLMMGSIAHDMGYRYHGLLLAEPNTRTVSFVSMEKEDLDSLLADITKSVCGLSFPGTLAKLALGLGGKKAWDNARANHRTLAQDFPDITISK
jgi:hypothetical protein